MNERVDLNRKRKFTDAADGSKEKLQKISTDDLKCDDNSGLSEKSENNEGHCRIGAGGVYTKACRSLNETESLVGLQIVWKELRAENLNCDYCVLYNRAEADQLLQECERTLTYNDGNLSKVHIFGKWHDIPRKQVAHGDSGLSYTFSNTTIPARSWIPLLERIRDRITEVTGYAFNFVLVNRYKDGTDHIGEHRDDEKDLVGGHPIASLSLGQPRDFLFKHADARGKNARRSIAPVAIQLEHGSLLMMKHPTNTYWYHSLPQRKRLTDMRINMTFRKMVPK